MSCDTGNEYRRIMRSIAEIEADELTRRPYGGPIFAGMSFTWGDLGRCTVIDNPKGIGEAVRFRAADGRTFQNSEAYWRRMAENITESA
jgi:hypothetical protein